MSRQADYLPVVAALAGLAASGALAGGPIWTLLLPLAVSAVWFGLPHGGADHIVAAALRQRLWGPIAAYLAAIGLFLAVWWIKAPLAFWLFIAMTVFHWGTGDAHFAISRGWVPRFAAPTSALVRGALPMLGPLAFFPGRFAEVERAATSLFGGSGVVAGPIAQMVALGMLAMIILAHVGHLYHRGALRHSGRDVMELAVLLVLFAVVDPLVSVGVYFTFWHSVRHLDRLGGFYERRLNGRSLLRDVIPTTLISLVGIAGLAILVPQTPDSGFALLGVYLVAISALTFPHMLVVHLMDRAEHAFPWNG